MFQGGAVLCFTWNIDLSINVSCILTAKIYPFFNLKMKSQSIKGQNVLCISCIYRNLLILIERDHPPAVIASSQFYLRLSPFRSSILCLMVHYRRIIYSKDILISSMYNHIIILYTKSCLLLLPPSSSHRLSRQFTIYTLFRMKQTKSALRTHRSSPPPSSYSKEWTIILQLKPLLIHSLHSRPRTLFIRYFVHSNSFT